MKKLIVSTLFFIFSLSVTWLTVHATEMNVLYAHDEVNQKFIQYSYIVNNTSIDRWHLDMEHTYERTGK
jgi:hypothetical protein